MQTCSTVAEVLSHDRDHVSIHKKSHDKERIRVGVLLRDPISHIPLDPLKRGHVRGLRNRVLNRGVSGPSWNCHNALPGSALKYAQVEYDAGPGRSVCTGLNVPESPARTRRLAPGERHRLLGGTKAGHWLRLFPASRVAVGGLSDSMAVSTSPASSSAARSAVFRRCFDMLASVAADSRVTLARSPSLMFRFAPPASSICFSSTPARRIAQSMTHIACH